MTELYGKTRVVKTGVATAAGDTVLWTPAAGKKWRLLAVMFMIEGNATQAVAGSFDIVLRDATTPIGITWSVHVPAIAANLIGLATTMDLGEGILSGAVDRALNVNLSAALATGKVRINTLGIEV